jgi:hypothetical protein
LLSFDFWKPLKLHFEPMGRKKRTAIPKGSKKKPNIVAAAVELAGGATAVAKLCGVTRQSVYLWIQEWRVERLVDALKLSRASGIPIEKLAGEAYREEGEQRRTSSKRPPEPDETPE